MEVRPDVADAPTDPTLRIGVLELELEAARRTIDALTARLEALESAPDPMLTVDHDGVVVAANRTARETLDVDGTLLGARLPDLFEPADAAVVCRLAARGWPGAHERRLGLRDGRRVLLNARAVPGGREGLHHVTVRDVTHAEVLDAVGEERRRMEGLAALAGSLARDLNDPMSIVQGRLELLLELGEGAHEGLERHVAVALAHARRVSAVLQNLRLVGRAPATHLERVVLAAAWESARDVLGPRVDDLDVRLDLPADLAVGGSPGVIARVLANLVDRIADFCGRDARVVISARPRPDGVDVSVLGGPRSAAPSDLEPSAAHDEGHLDDGGLATSVARTLVNGVGGRLDVRSAGRRARFDLALRHPPAVRVKPRPVDATVLVVGDAALRVGVAEVVGREGFSVLGVPDAEAALEQLAAGALVEGVIASLLLPGASGLALVEEIGRDHPDLRGHLVLVGSAPLRSLPSAVRVVEAPLRAEDLLAALGRRVRSKR